MFFAWVCSVVYVNCVHLQIQVHMHMFVYCTFRLKIDFRCLPPELSTLLRQSLPVEPKVCWFAPHPTLNRIIGTPPCPPSFYMDSRGPVSDPQSQMRGKCYIQLTISPGPCFEFQRHQTIPSHRQQNATLAAYENHLGHLNILIHSHEPQSNSNRVSGGRT